MNPLCLPTFGLNHDHHRGNNAALDRMALVLPFQRVAAHDKSPRSDHK